ncbi:acyltransferase family protein [uncultured Catenibacterium sp.]|uniref:acyltransferase family protein n=1 Tax=uncultured Catenibacterium sp. TaxID=286142 RepID=UPI00261D4F28|nr:acyltransferase family protein [uncultured Catenibacterium sp.]
MTDISKNQSKMLKGIAIFFMLSLHLYNTTNYADFYKPLITIKGLPIIYFLSFICNACVPIYCFCAGYAAYLLKNETTQKRFKRIFNLLLTYWIILTLTCVIGLVLNNPNIPDSFAAFLGNAFLYHISYVGAWWFMQTYILLCITSKYLIDLVEKDHNIIMLMLSLAIYIIAYYFRMIHPIYTSVNIVNYIINALILYGTSQLSYVLGLLFRKYLVMTKLKEKLNNKQVVGIVLMLLSVILHIVIKSMIVAPFTGLIFITGFLLIDIKVPLLEKVLLFLGKHSTNVWLLHMQFYMIFFSKLIFSTHTVLGCIIILFACCTACSYIIDFIHIKFSLLIFNK